MKIFYFFLLFTSLFAGLKGVPLSFDCQGSSALLINPENHAVLYEKEADVLRYPASTTKLATALYALKLKGDQTDFLITATPSALGSLSETAKKKVNYKGVSHHLEADGTTIGIKNGEILSFQTLIRGSLICSGNDATNLIADSLEGSIPLFVEKMNLYLKEIGCKKTHFCNPHGLPDPHHQTTARDLAIIMEEALKSPFIVETIGKTRFDRPKTNKQAAATQLQTNPLIRSGAFFYPKAIGGKTGYHSRAKNNFVGAARFNERTLIIVLMGYQERSQLFKDAIALFEMAFNQPKVRRSFFEAGEQSFALDIPKANQKLKTALLEPLTLDYYPAEDPEAKCYLVWNELTLPIKKGEGVGELRLIDKEGKLIKKGSLVAENDVHMKWLDWFLSTRYWILLLLLLGLVISFFILI